MSHRNDMPEWNVPHNKRSLKGASMKTLTKRRHRRVGKMFARQFTHVVA